jgi:hypothetical protein
MPDGVTNISAVDESKPAVRPSRGALLSRDFSSSAPESIKAKLLAGIGNGFPRRVSVNTISGCNELTAEMVGIDITLAEWISTLIDSNVYADGAATNGMARKLCIADRDLLILYMRILTFGPHIWGLVNCPNNDCGKQMDISFDLTSIRMPQGRTANDFHWDEYQHLSKKYDFSFREPNGEDQELISHMVSDEPYSALLALLSRCIVSLNGATGISENVLRSFSREVIMGIEEIIASKTMSFDWDIALTCPECNRPFLSQIDICEYFWEELRICQSDLWKEVHTIAFYYHWPEKEILSLSRWKRKLYLNQIRNQLANDYSLS